MNTLSSKAATISANQDVLYLQIENTQIGFHAIWLRDNAMDAATRSPQNGQRLITIGDIPKHTKIVNATLNQNEVSLHFQPEDIVLDFPIPWLVENSYDKPMVQNRGWLEQSLQTWDAGLDLSRLTADFTALETNASARHTWLKNFAAFGFAKIERGPIENECLFEVINWFGYVRETNYGRYFDVRSEINPSNLAYTGLGLQAHTDNPYRDPVPTLQLLYCLENSVEGGDNFVVDGFHVAQQLKEENPEWFDVLSQYCARFEFKGTSDVALQARKPMIELAPDGQIIAIRFNNRSAAALRDIPFDKMPVYYEAYRRFAELVDDQQMQVNFRLEPGECFMVDNTRVMHARKAYSGEGRRWLQGCYADVDSLYSTLRSAGE